MDLSSFAPRTFVSPSSFHYNGIKTLELMKGDQGFMLLGFLEVCNQHERKIIGVSAFKQCPKPKIQGYTILRRHATKHTWSRRKKCSLRVTYNTSGRAVKSFPAQNHPSFFLKIYKLAIKNILEKQVLQINDARQVGYNFSNNMGQKVHNAHSDKQSGIKNMDVWGQSLCRVPMGPSFAVL